MSKRTRLLSKLKHVYSHNTKLVLDVSNDDIGLIIEALATKIELNKRNLTADILEEYMKFEDECIQKDFTFKSLLEAREKQIPKKPLHSIYYPNGRKHHHIYCGKCGMYRQRVSMSDNYCRNCGTKIDWSEVNE